MTPPLPVSNDGIHRDRAGLIVLLLVSLAMRLVLVASGGQFFFGDESRHERGVMLYQAVRSADWARAQEVLARPEHAGFTVLGAGITLLQHLSAKFSPWGDWTRPEHVIFSYPLGAGWLSLFAVLNIWLVHGIAQRAGADRREAAAAAVLVACSNTAFYYGRHFLPYDAALTFALLAIFIGLTGRRSLVVGLLAGVCFHIYNGYWYLVPVILVLHAVGRRESPGRWRRLVASGTGAAGGLLLPIAFGLAIGGRQYWDMMVAFSGTVNQGLYREGWSLPWEYFWHSEGVLGIAVILGISAACVTAACTAAGLDHRARLWLGAIAMSYAWLVLFSVGLEKFVVYARSVKPLVPFFCLAGGWAAARLLSRRPHLAPIVLTSCCLFAAVGLLPHFARIFPAEVEKRVLREFGNPKHALSVSGSLYVPLAMTVQRPGLALVNAQLLYPVRDYLGYPAGETIFRIAHVLSYPPFQYESHNPRERMLLREHDISIRLIRLAQPSAVPDDLPVQLRFSAFDRPDGRRL